MTDGVLVAQTILVDAVEKFLSQWSALLFERGAKLLEEQNKALSQDEARKLLKDAFGGILSCTVDESGVVLLYVNSEFTEMIGLTEAKEIWKTWAGGDKSQQPEQSSNSSDSAESQSTPQS